jgi:methionyl-tRNA formyltransferase
MSGKLKIVFMGTPEFAVESLRALISSGHEVVGVITAPDKPSGRGNKIVPSPVKEFAIQNSISPVLQPVNLKSVEFQDELKSLQADIQVVVAFRMLPEAVWAMPPKGTINLHASLLPDYRGAAPINWAIINGENRSGVTTFFIEKEIDTGHVLYTEEVLIGPDTTAGELHDLLMMKGAQLLVKTVDSIAKGDYNAIPQIHIPVIKELHAAPKIFREDCKIDWKMEGIKIHNLIRGLSPYPTAWTEITNDNEIIPVKLFESRFTQAFHHDKTGKLLTDLKNHLRVAVNGGFLEILSIQLPGKRRLPITEFLRGFQEIEKFRLVV